MIKQIQPRGLTLAELVAVDDVLTVVRENAGDNDVTTFLEWLDAALREIRGTAYDAITDVARGLRSQADALDALQHHVAMEMEGLPDGETEA